MSNKILITGASSGFGKLMTETLLNAGQTVVASMRDAEGRNRDSAAELKEKGAKIVEIDVGIEEQCASFGSSPLEEEDLGYLRAALKDEAAEADIVLDDNRTGRRGIQVYDEPVVEQVGEHRQTVF